MILRRSRYRYGAAVLVVGLNFLLKGLIESLVGPGPPLLLYLPGVTLGAWLGGLVTGLAATALAASLCTIAYFQPVGTFWNPQCQRSVPGGRVSGGGDTPEHDDG